MKIGPQDRTPAEIADQLLAARREYHLKREQLIKKSITSIEGKGNPILALAFVGALALMWAVAIISQLRIEWLWNWFQLVPVTIIFFLSYLAFFLTSKLIFSPSRQELSDDTSYFALFSACEARARRGWFSAVFGALHTTLLILYFIYKEVNWTDVFY